jgi:hypothetical protein
VSGGEIEVESGGRATTITLVGASELVFNSAVAMGVDLSGNGSLTVYKGGVLSGGLTLGGGSAVIAGTMGAGQTVRFTGAPATLALNNLPGFQAAISGLANTSEKIDLGGFTYAQTETRAWVQSGSSGTLTVRDGTKTASLTLIGVYTTSNFVLSDDGHGGTFIVDPPAGEAPAAALRLAEAIAGFGAPDGPVAVTSQSAGAALLSADAYAATPTSGRWSRPT